MWSHTTCKKYTQLHEEVTSFQLNHPVELDGKDWEVPLNSKWVQFAKQQNGLEESILVTSGSIISEVRGSQAFNRP